MGESEPHNCQAKESACDQTHPRIEGSKSVTCIEGGGENISCQPHQPFVRVPEAQSYTRKIADEVSTGIQRHWQRKQDKTQNWKRLDPFSKGPPQERHEGDAAIGRDHAIGPCYLVTHVSVSEELSQRENIIYVHTCSLDLV